MDRRTPNAERKHRLNREIMAPQVRLNGVDNEPLGIVNIMDALQMAGDKDVDLVEIAATADPPVCRLMDYGKFKYQEQKKAAEAKAKQKIIEIKEVKFRPGTDEGDYAIKMRNLRRFISEDGDKGKVTLRYRGREITHQDIGMRLAGAHPRRTGRRGGGGAHAQARRPADDHGAGAEEEVNRGIRCPGLVTRVATRSRCRPTSTA